MMDTQILSPQELSGTFLRHEPDPPARILVVDDESLIRRLNARVLLDSGYQVDVAEDGAEAWEALQLCNYDLLITDNDMPIMSGVELLKRIHVSGMVLPVIMATATFPEEEFARCPWLPLTATLLKPYTLAELLGMVRNILHASASHTELAAPLQNWQAMASADILRGDTSTRSLTSS